jgi:hypothetical protein
MSSLCVVIGVIIVCVIIVVVYWFVVVGLPDPWAGLLRADAALRFLSVLADRRLEHAGLRGGLAGGAVVCVTSGAYPGLQTRCPRHPDTADWRRDCAEPVGAAGSSGGVQEGSGEEGTAVGSRA